MGILADAVLSVGGRGHRRQPRALFEREIAHQGVNDLCAVETMQERKLLMGSLSDAFVGLPGGVSGPGRNWPSRQSLADSQRCRIFRPHGRHDRTHGFFRNARHRIQPRRAPRPLPRISTLKAACFSCASVARVSSCSPEANWKAAKSHWKPWLVSSRCALQKTNFLGTFTAHAANESAHAIEAVLLHAEIAGKMDPGAEIEEIAWIRSHRETSLPFAPLTEMQVFPLFEARQLRQHVP
jgi:putative lysine decarboxylase